MEQEIILLDTSILIDFYRKKDKSKSTLFLLDKPNRIFAISAITHFEIYSGIRNDQFDFWNSFFQDFIIFPFNTETSSLAAKIDIDLKKNRKQIEIPDLIIAATALLNNLSFATLNKKHFERIEKLILIN